MSAEPIRIAVLTTGRQDYGILRSTLKLLASDRCFDLRLWVGGMHLSDRFGRTVDHVRADGFDAFREIDFLTDPSSPSDDAAGAIRAVTEALGADAPRALILLGDRTETVAAAVAAVIARVPIVHLHGGEESEGAIDNVVRHAVTKLSHLHLVSNDEHARRVLQMGEQPESVAVVGAPGLDNLYRDDLPSDTELAGLLGGQIGDKPVVLVTMHPTTTLADPLAELPAVSAAMSAVEARYVITAPNADAGGARIAEHWQKWVRTQPAASFVAALGERAYWALMRRAHVVLGNSSSGIVEAPAAGALVINVGERQRGRFRYGDVADVAADRDAVRVALERSLATKRPVVGAAGGYPAGPAAPRILDALRRWHIPTQTSKRFRDLKCLDN